jgi:hypothetical protein
MQHHNTYMKKLSLISVLCVGLALFLLSIMPVSVQPLSKDTLTGNLTEEIDISINPDELLLANETVSNSIKAATDTDMNTFPP